MTANSCEHNKVEGKSCVEHWLGRGGAHQEQGNFLLGSSESSKVSTDEAFAIVAVNLPLCEAKRKLKVC